MNKGRDWKQVIDDWQASGMSITGFCARNHISTSSFYKYKALYADECEQCEDKLFTPVVMIEDADVTFKINGVTISCDTKDLPLFLRSLR